MNRYKFVILVLVVFLCSGVLYAQVDLEKEVLITELGLHFDGSKVSSGATNPVDNAPYDYFFGRNISAHGDCIKTYNNYVFMTWYRGGKGDRHVMLTRYNTLTGTMATIEFPHRHTGYQNKYWIGESHNTIAVAVSPLNGTIHLLYDMHSYSRTKPSDGSLSDDYFRYSFSVGDAVSLSDAEFTLDKFIKNSSGGYKHLSLNGGEDYANFSALTYPQFFLNDAGDIFMYMREGGNNNGGYKFSRYDASTSTWSNLTHFNVLNAKSIPGITYNWGLYGNMKYVNGKIRVGFQRRSSNNSDKYLYQNGVYYAYSDNQDGTSDWKNHAGANFSLPLYDADFIKVMEPGDYVQTTQEDKVYIVGDFDWTVTDSGDVHIISKVKDNENNVTKRLHTYKPAGASDFTTSEDFAGGTSIYTSGENVYIIGLTASRRVFVDKAVGGTNNFTRIYEATSGKTFDHGRVHVNNGKLYYYLMEEKSGNAQPLYLQIIDLGIVPADPTNPNNFKVQTIGETCKDKKNGKVVINADDTYNYIAKINDTDYEFTKSITIENLVPGIYDLCIEVQGENFEQCYEVIIEGGTSLSGKIQVNKQSATVSVTSGSGPFIVFKNGEEILETNEILFSVSVNQGDELKVKSKVSCQGEISEKVNLLDTVRVYPNPSNRIFEIYIPSNKKKINIKVYDIHSQLILEKLCTMNAGKAIFDLKENPAGLYFVKVGLEEPIFIKVI